MQGDIRLASYCFFMGSVSCRRIIHDIVGHEGPWDVPVESDSYKRPLFHYASAGGCLRLFWRFLMSLFDHIRDYLHVTQLK
jgi:hypothetical protein